MRAWEPLSGITVRSVRLQDLFHIWKVRTEAAALDQPPGRIGQHTIDPLSALPVVGRDRRAFIALAGRHPVGIIDLRVDNPNHRWVLARAASGPKTADVDPENQIEVWRKLLAQASRAAGAARAKRIHAVFSDSSPVMPALHAAGFTAYAQETVLMAQRLPTNRHRGDVRRQESSDVWSVHQLYHSITPRPVQYAEALTSNFWDCRAHGLGTAKGYIIDNGYEIAAYCRVSSAHGRHVMALMVQQHHLDLMEPLLNDVVYDLSPSDKDELYISVPDYTQEYVDPLQRLGFQSVGRQVRLVKYIAIPRRMQLTALEDLAREMPDRVPAGTPTFYRANCEPRYDAAGDGYADAGRNG